MSAMRAMSRSSAGSGVSNFDKAFISRLPVGGAIGRATAVHRQAALAQSARPHGLLCLSVQERWPMVIGLYIAKRLWGRRECRARATTVDLSPRLVVGL